MFVDTKETAFLQDLTKPSLDAVQDMSKQPVFGDILRAAREAQGLSQVELAAKSDVPRCNVSRIENSRIYPRLQTMRLLAAGLGAQLVIGFKTDPKGETT